MELDTVERAIDALFPQCPPIMVDPPDVGEDVPLLSIEKINTAFQKLQGKPGDSFRIRPNPKIGMKLPMRSTTLRAVGKLQNSNGGGGVP